MIEGVRLLPYVAAHARLKDRYFWQDCDACKANPKVERWRMKCGWIPSSKWAPLRGNDLHVPGSGIKEPVVCPGYSTRIAPVQEVARAWGHWDKGQLWDRYGDPTNALVELVELFNQERAGAEGWYLDEYTRRRDKS